MNPFVIGVVLVGLYLVSAGGKKAAAPVKTPTAPRSSAPRSFWGSIDPTVPGSVGNRIIGDIGRALPGLVSSLGGTPVDPVASDTTLPIDSTADFSTVPRDILS